jgi:hypothetical protein
MRNPVFSVALLLIGVVSAGSAPLQAACPGGVSTSFKVSGEVTNRAVFDLNKLERFPPAQANVTYFAAGSVVTAINRCLAPASLIPFFGGSQIMVAYATGGQSLGTAGFARIVVPGDKAGGRFVSNIATIEVRDATTDY